MSFSQGKNLDHKQMRKFQNVHINELEGKSIEALKEDEAHTAFTISS